MPNARVNKLIQGLLAVHDEQAGYPRDMAYERLLNAGQYSEAEMRAAVDELRSDGMGYVLNPLKDFLKRASGRNPYAFLTR